MAEIVFVPAGGGGAGVSYTPSTPTDWRTPVPTNVSGALDALAARPVVEEAGANRTLTAADNDVLILCTAVGGCTVTVDPLLPLGFRCLIAQIGAGTVDLDDAGGATTFIKPSSTTTPPETAEQGSTIGLQMVQAATALVYGSLG